MVISRLGDPISRCRYDALMRWMRPPPPAPAPEQSGRKEKECSVTQSRRVHQCTSRCTHCMHSVQSLVLIYAAQLYAKLFTKCIESHSDSSTIRDILGWCELQSLTLKWCEIFGKEKPFYVEVVYTPCLLVYWFICLISSRLGVGGDTLEV